MGGGTKETQQSEPWAPIQPYLKDIAGGASELYGSGGFSATPYGGERVAGFGDITQEGQQSIMDTARGGAPLVGQAQGMLSNMMNADYQNDRLDAVKQDALASAIPAAAAQFAGGGMADSTQAMAGIGRAAAQAVAPYEYGAFESAQNRAMQSAGMAPGLEMAGYAPAQMMLGVGGAQDAMSQAMIDSEMAKYYEGQGQSAANLQNFANLMMGMGGLGGQSTGTARESPGFGSILGTGLGVLGFLSDRRAKENISRIGKTGGGTNVYAYNYKGDPTLQVGVMADEVPHAIGGYVNGFAVVDYGRVV